jgi:hypothetical protein
MSRISLMKRTGRDFKTDVAPSGIERRRHGMFVEKTDHLFNLSGSWDRHVHQ